MHRHPRIMDKNITPPIFPFISTCNQMGSDVIILGWTVDSITMRIEYNKEGRLKFDPSCENSYDPRKSAID